MRENVTGSGLIDGDDALAIRSGDRVVDAAVIESIGNAGGARTPLQFTLRASVESGRLTVEHLVGDPVPLEQLGVRVGRAERSLGEGTLGPGESTSIEVPEESAGSIRVIRTRPDSGTMAVVAAA